MAFPRRCAMNVVNVLTLMTRCRNCVWYVGSWTRDTDLASS